MAAVPDPLACALFLIGALTLTGFFHAAWMRSLVSQRFAIPLDGGYTIRGRRLFGDNKTVRGFMAMVPGAGLTFFSLALMIGPGATSGALWALSPLGYAALGILAGLGFMLGELPNSFVKRQLDIAPGQPPRGRLAALACFVVDRLDSILGMLAAVSLAVPTSWLTWIYVIVLGSAIHWSFSLLLFRLGVKARPA